MDNNSNSFLDRNTIMAIGLSIVFFVGWQFYVQKKYPQKNKEKTAITVEKTVDKNSFSSAESGTVTTGSKVVETNNIETKQVSEKESIFNFKSKDFDLELSSYGMGFKEVSLKAYTDRKNEPIHIKELGVNKYNFSTFYKGNPVLFNIKKVDEDVYIGTGTLSEKSQIEKTIEIDRETFSAQVSIKVKGEVPKEPLETFVGNKAVNTKSSMFMPAYEGTEFFVINEGSEERERVDNEKSMTGEYAKSTLASIGSQYFTLALLDSSGVIPSTKVNFDPKTLIAEAKVLHKAVENSSNFEVNYLAYVGPKKYDILVGLDKSLAQTINYGVFSILSKPMLTMLKWLHSLFGNWGLAIILLTIFIRVLLLPINISSFKSMKKMQLIQPQLKAIKEKYKDDPQRVNQETMALMKREKANPIGGCLPMLLQLPVFFALYSVLGQSVELYKSPFIFWIKDLSYQDPFYVLPVAVGALYFVQMSLTPQTTMDPTQQKVMKFIPLLFCFFMITVPSGLTLYFFVNTIFGIGQQFILHKDKKKVVATA